MNFVTINIAYIADNQSAVNELIADLSTVNVNFNLIDAADFIEGEDFKDHLTNDNHPCFLMVSDNFLKSIPCLQNGLSYLQTLIKKELVIPIIIDGVHIDEAGNKEVVATEFEKVSNVIKYMNFWQEKYLDLRKLKRSIPASDEEEFSIKLKAVRSISSEVGEFLRTLRDTNHATFEDFSANNYEYFFRFFGDESDYLKFVASRANAKTSSDPIEAKEPIKVVEASITQDVEAIQRPPAFLPFEDLVTEKDKIENTEEISASSISDSEMQSGIEELMEQGDPNEIEVVQTTETTPINPIEVTEIIEAPSELIAMDPEWLLAGAEVGEDTEEEEPEEIPLSELVETAERPLTDTEMLALELANKIPVSVEEEQQEVEEEEEEMISLEDLMGEELLSATVVSNESTTKHKFVAGELETSEKTEADLFSQQPVKPTYASITEELTEEEDVDEDELEGYFMDEGEETEELEEEISEVEVLQAANILVQSGKVAEGTTLLEDILKEAPEFVSVRYQYAAYLAKYQNNFKAASAQLAILLEQEPNNESAMFFLGELAEAERDYLTAKSYYERVYDQNNEFPNVAYKLGMLMVNHLDEPTAQTTEYFDIAYQQNPRNINALYQFGLLKSEEENEEDEAIAALEEVLEKAPEHPFANYDLALIYHRQGDKSTALRFYEKAAEVNPELKTTVNDQAFAMETAAKIEAAAAEKLAIGASMLQEEQAVEMHAIAADLEPVTVDNPQETSFEATEFSEESYEVGTKIALITGATSGIGKAIATKLAKEGYSLILTGRRFSRLFQLKEVFEKEHNTAVRLLPFDIQQAASVQTALAELEEEWQNVDVLVNNAGLARGESAIHEGDLDHWEAMIDTNIKGLLFVTREIAPYMVKRKQGQIINICSLAGKEVYPNNGVYCATKHAVDALTKAMRIDLHKYNIRVSQVSPGFVEDTEFAAVKTDNNAKAITDFIPVNATDVADVIHFMVSRPSHVTLQEVVLTGTQQASANVIDRSGRGELV